MATKIRPEVSIKNKYWISKNRHYELKYFCLQYPEWRCSYRNADGYSEVASQSDDSLSERTAEHGILRAKYIDRIRLIERIAKETDEYLADYILRAVTENLSFTYLKNKLSIPCGRDMYYSRYRKFFYLLSKARD